MQKTTPPGRWIDEVQEIYLCWEKSDFYDYETEGEWEIQLSMEINFVSSKDSDEIRIMHTKSDYIDVLMGSKTNDILKELFKSLLQKYQEGLKESMRGSESIFDSANLLYYQLQKQVWKEADHM